MPLTLSDLNEIDRHYWPSLCHIRDCKDAEEEDLTLSQLDLPFTTASASGHEVVLSQQHRRVTHSNRDVYLQLALNYRLHEFDSAIKAISRGLGQVVPLPLLSLFTGPELEGMVCGSPEIPLALLKSVTTYKGVEAHCSLVRWFWEVMEEYSHVERSLFLRFVWGRTRLPRTLADFRGRDFVLQVHPSIQPFIQPSIPSNHRSHPSNHPSHPIYQSHPIHHSNLSIPFIQPSIDPFQSINPIHPSTYKSFTFF